MGDDNGMLLGNKEGAAMNRYNTVYGNKAAMMGKRTNGGTTLGNPVAVAGFDFDTTNNDVDVSLPKIGSAETNSSIRNKRMDNKVASKSVD